MYRDFIFLNQANCSSSPTYFFKKSKLILVSGWHAAHVEQTRVVRQFKDYPKCVGKISLRMLFGSQFPRKFPDLFSFSQPNNLPLWHLVLFLLFLIRNFKIHVSIEKAESD